jgi:hypothetical protein
MHWKGMLALAGALLLAAAAATASEMLRCQNKIIEPGDTAYDVRSLCGPPDDIQQRSEQRRVARAVDRPCLTNPTGRCPTVEEQTVDVLIDEWTYDFGPQRFIQYLTFEAGKLRHIRSGEYGHKQQP